MATRQWHLDRATASYRSLEEVLPDLTEEEVLAALALEYGTLRRGSILNRLISRAGRLREIAYVNDLKERYLP